MQPSRIFGINSVVMRANFFSTSTERSREEKWYHCTLARVKVKEGEGNAALSFKVSRKS